MGYSSRGRKESATTERLHFFGLRKSLFHFDFLDVGLSFFFMIFCEIHDIKLSILK